MLRGNKETFIILGAKYQLWPKLRKKKGWGEVKERLSNRVEMEKKVKNITNEDVKI